MNALSRSAILQILGLVGGIASFAIVFWGVLNMAPGPWLTGLFAALVSAILLLIGTIGAALKRANGRRGLILGLVAIAAFAVVAVYFSPIIHWIADRFF